MASSCTAITSRQQLGSCSGRGPWPVTRRLALPVLPPTAGRRPAAVRASSLADEAAEQEQQDMEDKEQQRLYGNREPVKRMEFVYMTAEEAAAEEAAAAAAFAQGIQEYADLQEWLLFRTWRFGLLFSGYLVIAASGEAAVCELVGAAAGYGYFKWLIADLDKLQPGDRIPLKEAEKVAAPLMRGAAKLFASYRQALQPRLLVLPGLLALVAAFNTTVGPEEQLGLVEQGCLLAGFLSWKVALVLKIYEDQKPKPLTPDDILRASRPVLVQVDDVKLDIREVGKKVEKQRQEQEQQAAAQAAQPDAAEGQPAQLPPQ